MPISAEDFVVFCERAIDAMTCAVERLDDELVNTAPAFADANTPFQIVTHALGACEWWTAHMVCGHPSARERDLEFEAVGTVSDLTANAARIKADLRDLLPELASATQLQHPPRTQLPLAGEWTVGAALMHAFEELCQHLGHLEITADVLIRGRQ